MEEEWRSLEEVTCYKSYKGFLWDFKEKESIQDNIQ